MKKDPKRELLTDLVARAKTGDASAFGKIFRVSYRGIYDYITRRVGDEKDVEDLTMQVFLKGLDHITDYEERGYSVKSWLYRIAHNLVVDYYRARKETIDLDMAEKALDRRPLPEEEVISEERTEIIRNEIMKLPPAQAEVIILRYLEDMSVAEAAWVLEKKEVTVRTLQFKGLRNLRNIMPRPL